MTDDHRAMIEQARAAHVAWGENPTALVCERCAENWPCLTDRLGDALDQETARASALDQQIHDERLAADRHCLEWSERLDDAESRAERLAGYAKHRPGCYDSTCTHYRDHDCPCSCGLSAALGLAAEKPSHNPHPTDEGLHCAGCGNPWPCPTERAKEARGG